MSISTELSMIDKMKCFCLIVELYATSSIMGFCCFVLQQLFTVSIHKITGLSTRKTKEEQQYTH